MQAADGLEAPVHPERGGSCPREGRREKPDWPVEPVLKESQAIMCGLYSGSRGVAERIFKERSNTQRVLFPLPLPPPLHSHFPGVILPCYPSSRGFWPPPLGWGRGGTTLAEAAVLLFVQPALFILCAGNELFYCLLYLLNFSEGPLGRRRGAGLEHGRASWPALG